MSLFTLFDENPKRESGDDWADKWNAFVLAAGGVDAASDILNKHTEEVIISPEALQSYLEQSEGFDYFARSEAGMSPRKVAADLEDAFDIAKTDKDTLANFDEVLLFWRQDNVTESVQEAIWFWIHEKGANIADFISAFRLDKYDTHREDSLFWAWFRTWY